MSSDSLLPGAFETQISGDRPPESGFSPSTLRPQRKIDSYFSEYFGCANGVAGENNQRSSLPGCELMQDW